ncbi:hypothetical protein [Salinicoccus sp. RF5]|uniref:hypothetical protein n=1 Tax=Salinicoccus sp. RF5 TaxID=2748874 RepID=UPI001E6251A7|nr:hypothetical protein [Salinicoccus sp. RF5]MCC4723556.1 hypothetical protein [Salinicoccus sp. RF5]
MANTTYSILKFRSQDDLRKIVDYAIKDGRDFDFNSIEPIPDALKVEHIPYQDAAIGSYYNTLDRDDQAALIENLEDKHYTNVEDIIEQAAAQEKEQILVAEERIDLGQKYYENIMEHGYPDFFEWANAHWNTKGNAIDTVVDEEKLEISFSTSSSVVADLMKNLYEKTGVPFVYQYTDDTFTVYGEMCCDEEGIRNSEIDEKWVKDIFAERTAG